MSHIPFELLEKILGYCDLLIPLELGFPSVARRTFIQSMNDKNRRKEMVKYCNLATKEAAQNGMLENTKKLWNIGIKTGNVDFDEAALYARLDTLKYLFYEKRLLGTQVALINAVRCGDHETIVFLLETVKNKSKSLSKSYKTLNPEGFKEYSDQGYYSHIFHTFLRSESVSLDTLKYLAKVLPVVYKDTLLKTAINCVLSIDIVDFICKRVQIKSSFLQEIVRSGVFEYIEKVKEKVEHQGDNFFVSKQNQFSSLNNNLLYSSFKFPLTDSRSKPFLEFLKKSGFSCDSTTVLNKGKFENLEERIRFCIFWGFYISEKDFIHIMNNESINLLYLAIRSNGSNGPKLITDDVLTKFDFHGQGPLIMKRIKILLQHCKITTLFIKKVIRSKNIDILFYVMENYDVPKETYYLDYVAETGDLLLLQYFHKLGFGASKLAMDNAAEKGFIDIVIWLARNRKEGPTKMAVEKCFKAHPYPFYEVGELLLEMIHMEEFSEKWETDIFELNDYNLDKESNRILSKFKVNHVNTTKFDTRRYLGYT